MFGLNFANVLIASLLGIVQENAKFRIGNREDTSDIVRSSSRVEAVSSSCSPLPELL